jgi:hypothetical protein
MHERVTQMGSWPTDRTPSRVLYSSFSLIQAHYMPTVACCPCQLTVNTLLPFVMLDLQRFLRIVTVDFDVRHSWVFSLAAVPVSIASSHLIAH